jgi:hypothetical protein
MILKSDLMREVSKSEIALSIDRSTIHSLVDRLEDLSVPVLVITEDNLLEECCRLVALLLIRNISSYFSVSGSSPLDTENYNLTTNVQKLHMILVTNLYYKKWLLFKLFLN